MQKQPVLEVRDVTIELGGKVILKDINLKVYEQESVVIIGPSGAGKTVLLKTLAGVYTPTTGSVMIDGEDWTTIDSDEKHELAKKTGMLFQRSALFDALTVTENITFPINEHYELPKQEVDERAEELLKMVNLEGEGDKLPHELSGGMQKRLGIARALALNPKILFYDAPMAGQDPVQSDQMAKLILDLKQKNKSTLITVTSSMNIVHTMADRVIMVVNSDLLDLGSPKEMKDHPDPRVQQFIHGRLDGPIKV